MADPEFPRLPPSREVDFPQTAVASHHDAADTKIDESVEAEPKATPKARSWIPALAGYRAIAAFAVLVFHVISIDSRTDWLGVLVVPLGPAAVATFFVLSGFLVYRPFVAWAFGDGPPIVYWRYVARRAARILPLYWVVLTVHLFVIQRQDYTFDELITAYTLTQTFRGSMVFVPPFVAWSLSIELWFSFVLPIIAFVFRWLGNWRPWHHRFRIQIGGLVVIGLISMLFRSWALQFPGSGRNLWVPAYFDWFGYGLALAVVAHHWTRAEPPKWVRQVADNPWMPLSLAVTAYWAITQLGLPVGFVNPTVFQAQMQFSLQAFVAFTIVASATLPGSRIARSNGVLASATFAKLGAWSYGLYLIHDFVIDELLDHWPDMNRLLMVVVVTAITLAIAAPLHYLVERPSSAFIDRQLKQIAPKERARNPIPAVVPANPEQPVDYLVEAPAAAAPAPELIAQVPRLASGRFSAEPVAEPFETEPWLSPNRPIGMNLIAVFASLVATIAAQPGQLCG